MSQTPTDSPYRRRAADLEGIRIALSIPARMSAVRAINDAMADLEQFGGLYGAGGIGTTLRSLNPTITARPSDQLPLGSWLFIPKCRAAANADTSITSLPAGFHTPETLAAYLGVSTLTIYSWNSSGYGPPFVKLGNLVRYTYEDVELWLARQLELSRG